MRPTAPVLGAAAACVLLGAASLASLLWLRHERALHTEAAARDTLHTVRADRRALQHDLDSVRVEVERLAAARERREAEYVARLEAALSEAQNAGTRADSLEAELRATGLGTVAAGLLDEMALEHGAQVERLEEALALQDHRYQALWAYTGSLEGQTAAARSLEDNLREANRLLAEQGRALNLQLHPPLRLRLAKNAKVALPALATGIIIGALLVN